MNTELLCGKNPEALVAVLNSITITEAGFNHGNAVYKAKLAAAKSTLTVQAANSLLDDQEVSLLVAKKLRKLAELIENNV